MVNPRLRVLVVEDDRVEREELAEWLERREKLVVDQAASGEECLRKIQDQGRIYDAVILDQVLPGKNGIETMRQIHAGHPDTLVVILTGYGADAGLEALRAGAYRYILKPPKNEEIALLVEHIHEIRQIERRLVDEHRLIEATSRIAEQVVSLPKVELLKLIAIEGCQLLDAPVCVISELDLADEKFKVAACAGDVDEEYRLRVQLDKENTATRAFLETRKPLALTEIQAARWYQHKAEAARRGWISLLSMPMAVQDRVFAILDIYTDKRRSFAPWEKQILATFAAQAAVAIGQANLLHHQHEISRLALLGDYDVLADYVTLATSDLTGTAVSLWMIDESSSGPVLRIKAGRGLREEYRRKAELSLDPSQSVVAACLDRKQPLVKRDIFDDTEPPPFFYKDEARVQGWRSFLSVPLIGSSDQALGALSVYGRRQRDYSDVEKNLLLTFANQAAIALETRARQKRLEQLVRSGQVTMQEVSAEYEVLEQFVELAQQLTGAPCAAIYPYDPQQGEFYDEDRVAVIGLLGEKKEVSHKPRKKGLAAIVRHTGLVVVHDLNASDIDDIDYGKVQERIPLDRERLLKIIRGEDFIEREKIKAFVGVSLRAAEDADVVQDQAEVGVLYINFRTPHHFSSADLSLIQLFAQQVASLIRAARLRDGLQEQLRIRTILAEASKAIAQPAEQDEILKTVFEQAFRLTGKTTGFVMAVEADQRLRIVDFVGVPDTKLAAFHSRPTFAHEGSFGIVTRTGKMFESRDTAKDLKTGRMLDLGLPIPPQVTNVPLKSEGKVVGILVVDTVVSSSQVKEALQALAEVAGIALERANRTRTLSGLNEAGKALTGAPDLQSVLAEAVRRTETLLGADAVVLYLYDQQSDYLQIPPTQAGLYQPNVLMQPGTFHENSVPRRLIRSGKSHFARNAARDKVMAGSIRAADDVPTFVQRERIASSAGVLLKVMNEIVGVLFVNYRSRHAFGESEREKIELFASQAAIAIRNAALLEELSDRATRLKLLHDIASSVSARAVGPKEVSLLIVQSLSDKVFKEAACAIRLYNSKTDEFIPLQIATGPLKDLIEHPPRSDGTSRYVVREKAPLYIEDTSSPPSPGVPCVRQEFLERGVKAIAYLPLIGEGGVVTGILYMNLFTPYRFSENDRLILELFAHQAAVSIERERQFELLQAVNQLGDNLAALE